MRRRLVAIAAGMAALVGGGLVTRPHSPTPRRGVWVAKPVMRFGACISTDCGPDAATLHWNLASWAHTTTGYYVFLNGVQQADVSSSPWVIGGGDCSVTVSLGVQQHDNATPTPNTGPMYTVNYVTPTCGSAFPLQVSTNGRYLESAGGQPWLMVGDSPQSVIGNMSTTNANAYLDDRESHGFDAVWINLLCASYTACSSSGQTYDGVSPFTTGSSPGSYDFSTPNSTYFTRAHSIVAHAQADGIEVLLDPVETGTAFGETCTSPASTEWMSGIIANGNGTVSTSDKDYQYGQYLGNTFKDLHNVMWMSGNDFQCVETASDNNDVQSVVNGIASTDPGALQTMESDYDNFSSSSLVDGFGVSTGWSGLVQLNASYTYNPAYAEDLTARGQTTKPMFLAESNYEGQKNSGTDGCGPGPAGDTTSRNCRLQEWWTMTSGAAGQMYGGPCYGITNTTTLSSCDTTGVAELQDQTNLLNSVAWQTLQPDTAHTLLYCTTSGTPCGSCPSTGSITGVTCVTDAADSFTAGQATLALAYLPDPSAFSTVTVNLADFSSSVTARWWDPTNGSFTSISGSPFANSGTHSFTPASNNNAGGKDWVLVLQ